MKIHSLKKVLAISLAAAMTLAVTACGGSAASDSSSGSAASDSTASDSAAPAQTEAAAPVVENDGSYDECTLTISWWGGDSRHEATLAAIEAFEQAYPGITVESTYAAWDGWEEK